MGAGGCSGGGAERGAAPGAPAACPAATAGTVPQQGVAWRAAHSGGRESALLELAAWGPGRSRGNQNCFAMSYQKELVCGDWPSVVPATEDRSFKCSFSSGKSQWPHVASGCLWSGTAPPTLNHLQTGGLQARKGFSVWSGPYAIFQCFTRQYPKSQKIRKLKIPDTLGKQFPDVAVSWS